MGNAKCIPAAPDAIFLPYQAKWIEDDSRLKLIEKSRQIGLSWATAYAAVSRTALTTARLDQWVSSRDDIQAQLFLEDCKFWAGNLAIAAEDLGEQVLDPRDRQTAYVLRFASGRRINSTSRRSSGQLQPGSSRCGSPTTASMYGPSSRSENRIHFFAATCAERRV